MSFEVEADAYGAFMGRYSEPLAVEFAALLDLHRGRRALDVGCGPGALTAVLADRLGAQSVSAVEPSASFVAAARVRLPGVDIRQASADNLPYDDRSFDVLTAQLVIHFLTDPVAGIAEMARVTRPDGVIAACVWDHGGGRGPVSTFWRAARDVDPAVHDESDLPGVHDGQLVELFRRAGLNSVTPSTLTVTADFANVDEWWHPFTLGVGPAGTYLAGLEPAHRRRLRSRCDELLPDTPFSVAANAWTVTAAAGWVSSCVARQTRR